MQRKSFILTIDTTKFAEAKVGLKSADGKVVKEKRFAADRNLSQKLLPAIDKLLANKNLKPQDLVKIEVRPGPGSFTGTRIGVAVANTLAFSLGIPVNDKEMVAPVYGSPPKISPP